MTAKRPWYKRYPSDFRAATAGLPYNVKGTYSHVLDLIYDHGGPIDDKTADIARALGCDPHTWKTHRSILIKAGKLFVDLGKLMNGRAARELGKIPVSTSKHMGKIPETNVSGTEPRKPKRGKALNGTTAHPEKTTDTRIQIQTPGAPFGKGGATHPKKSGRRTGSGRRHKATNLENWAKAVELRRRWKDHGGGDGGTEDSGELS